MTETFVEGITVKIIEILNTAGSPQPLTGLIITLELRDKTGHLVEFSSEDVSPKVGVQGDPLDGAVFFKPASGDLTNALSPYLVRWRLTDGNGDDDFWPLSAPVKWVIGI